MIKILYILYSKYRDNRQFPFSFAFIIVFRVDDFSSVFFDLSSVDLYEYFLVIVTLCGHRSSLHRNETSLMKSLEAIGSLTLLEASCKFL